MNKKSRKVTLIVILILVLLIFMYILKQLKIKSNTQTDEEIMAEQVESYTSDKVCPRGMATLYSNYKGDRSLNDLYRNLNNFVEYLPAISKDVKDLNSETLSKYFNNNIEDINNYLGISSEEDFVEFVNYIDKYDFSTMNFKYCEIDTETYENTNTYLKFTLAFKYEEEDEPINFNISFSKKDNTKPIVIYSVNK